MGFQPRVMRQTVRVSAVYKRKEMEECCILIPIHYFFLLIFNLYKTMGWYVCLTLNQKQSDNSELEKPVLTFG